MTNDEFRLLPVDGIDADFQPGRSRDDIHLVDLVAGCTMKDLESLHDEHVDEAFDCLMGFVSAMDSEPRGVLPRRRILLQDRVPLQASQATEAPAR
jgi:hypothetical protein